jgi:hypothetical protein
VHKMGVVASVLRATLLERPVIAAEIRPRSTLGVRPTSISMSEHQADGLKQFGLHNRLGSEMNSEPTPHSSRRDYSEG